MDEVIRLCDQTLPEIEKRGVQVPTYDRSKVVPGVVHFGPSSVFFRGHLATYCDDLLRLNQKYWERWGIAAVSVQSADAVTWLQRQDNLFTLSLVQNTRIEHRVIGSVVESLFAEANKPRVFALLDQAYIVTLTITRAGYMLADDGTLDMSRPQLMHDITRKNDPKSALGFIVHALHSRWLAKQPPFVVASLDNLVRNGDLLRTAIAKLALQIGGREFEHWVMDEVEFPNTIVDRIVPERLKDALSPLTPYGIKCEKPIVTELYRSFVVSGRLSSHIAFADWKDVGVQLVHPEEYEGYRSAKLMLLNGSHLTIGLIGAHLGIKHVHDALMHPLVRHVTDARIEEMLGILNPVKGLNYREYINVVLERFANTGLQDECARAARDATRKMIVYILEPLTVALKSGKRPKALGLIVAIWFYYLVNCDKPIDATGTQESGGSDSTAPLQASPIAIKDERLAAMRDLAAAAFIAVQSPGGQEDRIQNLLAMALHHQESVFGELENSGEFVEQLFYDLKRLCEHGLSGTVSHVLGVD